MPQDMMKAKEPKPGKTPIHIDGTKYRPEGRYLTGAQLRRVPSPPVSHDRDLWLDIVDELDKLIEEDEVVELKNNMRFFTVPRVINPGQGITPNGGAGPMVALVAVLREQDQSFLDSLGCSVTLDVSDGFVNVVLADFPTQGLDQRHVDLLLRLPIGFPDATPDMFWVSPSLTAKGAAIPGTEVTENYLGQSWQRWSRHIGDQWRPGVDNLETYLAYVRRALAMAGGN